jgi:hypothetical protein
MGGADGEGQAAARAKRFGVEQGAVEIWLELRVKDADAAALAGDLRALIERYGVKSEQAGQPHAVYAAIAQM